jgi:hypothetical protein
LLASEHDDITFADKVLELAQASCEQDARVLIEQGPAHANTNPFLTLRDIREGGIDGRAAAYTFALARFHGYEGWPTRGFSPTVIQGAPCPSEVELLSSQTTLHGLRANCYFSIAEPITTIDELEAFLAELYFGHERFDKLYCPPCKW